MSEKIKDILQMPEVPDELKPENIPVLLEAKGKRKKKIRIAVTGTIAAAAACTLIAAGLSSVTQGNRNDAASNFTACDIGVQENGDAAGAADEEEMKAENYFEGADKEFAAEDCVGEIEGNGNVLSGVSADAGFENAEVKELFDFGETLCKVVQGNTSDVYHTAVLAYLLPSADELTDRIVMDGQFIKSERDGNKLSIVYISNDDSTEEKIVLNVEEGKLTEEK